MTPTPLNPHEKLKQFDELWSPKAIAQFEGFQFKLAKAHGEFVWHCHEDSDETFFVLSGELRVDFRDGQVTLKEGDMMVIPKGVEHKPYAENECHVMTLIRAGEVNTGNAPTNEKTADPDAWI